MKYNYRQQSALAGEFVEVLSIERNLGVKTLYAYKNDVDNMVKWIDMRGYSDLDADTIMMYFLYLQNEIELSPRSIRRKYVSIRQYCDFLNKELDMNEVFFKFSSRKFQIPKNLPKVLSKTEIQSLISVSYTHLDVYKRQDLWRCQLIWEDVSTYLELKAMDPTQIILKRNYQDQSL